MSDPGISGGLVVAAGLTVFGVKTGLDPAVLIAGLAGGLWAQSYQPPCPLWQRLALTILASLLAGYLAPPIAALSAVSDTVRGVFTMATLQLPVAVLVGLTSHRVLGPAVMRFAAKKVEGLSK